MKVIIKKKWADYQEGEEAEISDKSVLKACVKAGIIDSSEEINEYVKEGVVEESEQSENAKTITSEGKKGDKPKK